MAKKNRGSAQQQAVALAYREGAIAPTVVAQGRGLLAETIIERAHAAGVYVHESPALVGLLMRVDLDGQIPPELYRTVAELIAFVYYLENAGKAAEGWLPTAPSSSIPTSAVAPNLTQPPPSSSD